MKYVLAVLLFSPISWGQETGKLEKDLSFEDLLVNGKLQFSTESMVTVEEDKILDSLLGVRRDFKDRITRSSAKH